MGYHYRSRYEFILFFEKGKRKLHDLGTADILEGKRIRGGYPTEKPVEISDVLVRQSSLPGEIVLDPFMGSGSAGVAAVRNGRRFKGNDISEGAVRLSRERLNAAAGEEPQTLSSSTEPPPAEDSQLRLAGVSGPFAHGPTMPYR